MARLYSLNGKAGLISQHTSRQTKTLISIYHSEQADMDVEAGKYSIVCEPHNQVTNVGTLPLARYFAASPLTWCEVCNGNARQNEED